MATSMLAPGRIFRQAQSRRGAPSPGIKARRSPVSSSWAHCSAERKNRHYDFPVLVQQRGIQSGVSVCSSENVNFAALRVPSLVSNNIASASLGGLRSVHDPGFIDWEIVPLA